MKLQTNKFLSATLDILDVLNHMAKFVLWCRPCYVFNFWNKKNGQMITRMITGTITEFQASALPSKPYEWQNQGRHWTTHTQISQGAYLEATINLILCWKWLWNRKISKKSKFLQFFLSFPQKVTQKSYGLYIWACIWFFYSQESTLARDQGPKSGIGAFVGHFVPFFTLILEFWLIFDFPSHNSPHKQVSLAISMLPFNPPWFN